MGQAAEDFGYAGLSTDLVAQQAFSTALNSSRMRIGYAQWSAAMSPIMHALAVHGSLGPAGPSVAANYLVVLANMAAERGPEFAIEYDQERRKHIAAETIPVLEVAKYLHTLVDARAAAL